MSTNLRSLLANLHAIDSRYHDERSAARAAAEEAVREGIQEVKNELGHAGIRATFHHDADGSSAILEVRKKGTDVYESWEELELRGQDEEGALRELDGLLNDLASYLGWNERTIAV